MVQANTMDRGSDTLKSVLAPGVKEMDIRQTRRGCFQELLGCEANTEFKYFIDDQQVAYSLAESNCLLRICCPNMYPFEAKIVDAEGSQNELLTVERPCVPFPVSSCKCCECCLITSTFTSGGQPLGKISEDYYYCVPTFTVTDATEQPVYKIHPPTCCGGICVNCCTEGNPCCGKGCCKFPFHVFPYDQEETHGDAPYIGKILKRPKSLLTEAFTDANSFLVTFPDNSTAAEKGLLMGSALYFNATFFETDNS